MRWDDLLARPRRRDADGVLVVLEEVDDDTGTGSYRRAGESRRVRRPDPVSDFEPRSEFALEVKVLDGEVVDDDAPPVPQRRGRFVAAGVAAAGLAWLATPEARVKPAPFEYVAVDSWDAAVAALTGDALVLAGGQSLVPLMNLRLVKPARLVDINGIPGLIRRTGGVLRIGATVRQAALERSRLVAEGWPLLAQAVRHVGHPATRSRGTVGGSVAHADPRAELVAALAALDARYETTTRILVGAPTLEPGELLTSIELPPLPPGARTAFAEYARTAGDFADAAVAVVRAPGHAAIAVLGAGRATDAEVALRAGAAADVVAELAAELVDGDHPRALVAELTRRALAEATPA